MRVSFQRPTRSILTASCGSLALAHFGAKWGGEHIVTEPFEDGLQYDQFLENFGELGRENRIARQRELSPPGSIRWRFCVWSLRRSAWNTSSEPMPMPSRFRENLQNQRSAPQLSVLDPQDGYNSMALP